MKKRYVLGGLLALLILLGGWAVWSHWFAATRIGFLNYQVITLGQIAKSNDNSFIKIQEIDPEHLEKLDQCDFLFINGMGLRITEDQRAAIQKAADKGLPVISSAVTNPANDINSVDSVLQDSIKGYLSAGGRKNYHSMLQLVRKDVDGKLAFWEEPQPLVNKPDYVFYHAVPGKPDEENVGFNSVSSYQEFLKQNHLWKDGAPQIIITGEMGEPAEVIAQLEQKGYQVYPIRRIYEVIHSAMGDSIQPVAVINMAHGRLGDPIVAYLKQKNIPLFSPLNVNRLVSDWEEDKMGMNGGFLSQSVITPEIDGAILPYALFGHYKNEEGLQYLKAIPGRLERFVETVDHYVRLKEKPNSEKKIAIYYYKSPGKGTLNAAGMEVLPSLYQVLLRLKKEGYRVDHLPASYQELGALIQKQGSVLGTYAEGVMARFMKEGHPALVGKKEYESWIHQAGITEKKYQEVKKIYGDFPGDYMVTEDHQQLGVPRIQLGNVVLLPQMPAAKGDNEFKIVHGADMAPGHLYIASYLWARYGFGADAMIHFGTHGSLEFTPGKQVALGDEDWPDRLVGTTPHFYLYSIGNVGEGMMAKRRSYATLVSYLTPPFMESGVKGEYHQLMELIEHYNHKHCNHGGKHDPQKLALDIKKLVVHMGIHRDLELDSVLQKPYSEEDICRIEQFAEELSGEKVTGQLYTMGIPYAPDRIISSVYAMSVDPIAYSVWGLDKLRGKADPEVARHRSYFTRTYLNPAKQVVYQILEAHKPVNDALICQVAGVTQAELAKARQIEADQNSPKGMMAMMLAMSDPNKRKEAMSQMAQMKQKHQASGKKSGSMKGMMSEKLKKQMAKTEHTKEEIQWARAVMEVARTLEQVNNYRTYLTESPEREMQALCNGLNGGYIAPSPGGDPIANPNTLPTGRNLFSINTEETPTEAAWEKGKALAENTIKMYQKRHNDSLPRKVSYTLWSGEFIETEGATIAQILYMLGVEPIRDSFGRVTDIRLIPSKELGRPRIDVVVQTSGQLRDLAASRLFLITRAVEMAAQAKDDVYENQVAEGVVETERVLTEKGLSPKEARALSTYRVFGAANGGYGTGIQSMVMSSDRWDQEQQIAETYLNNMGAFYGSEKDWESFKQNVFEAALTRTDAVIQPRQSNTWGALSLDHVYEFMGGLNLAVRQVTGKDPDAYLSDYRNRNHARMQELKEAIGVESRTTILNPNYIREKMKGDASGAATFAQTIENTFGWNVMKPKAIDQDLWNKIYQVYVEDVHHLGVRKYFEDKNPAALQEMTAVMLEAVRKGYWKASAEQVKKMSEMHVATVDKFGPACSGFVCDNAKLKQFISEKVNPAQSKQYLNQIENVREQAVSGDQKDQKGMVMKKENLTDQMLPKQEKNQLAGGVIAAVVAVAVLLLVIWILRKKKKMRDTWKQ